MRRSERMLLAPLGRHRLSGGVALVDPVAARRAIDAVRNDLPVLWGEKKGVLNRLAGLVRHESLALTEAGIEGEVEWTESAAQCVVRGGAWVAPLWLVRDGAFEGLSGFSLYGEFSGGSD